MKAYEILQELFDPKLAIDLEWAEGSDWTSQDFKNRFNNARIINKDIIV